MSQKLCKNLEFRYTLATFLLLRYCKEDTYETVHFLSKILPELVIGLPQLKISILIVETLLGIELLN